MNWHSKVSPSVVVIWTNEGRLNGIKIHKLSTGKTRGIRENISIIVAVQGFAGCQLMSFEERRKREKHFLTFHIHLFERSFKALEIILINLLFHCRINAALSFFIKSLSFVRHSLARVLWIHCDIRSNQHSGGAKIDKLRTKVLFLLLSKSSQEFSRNSLVIFSPFHSSVLHLTASKHRRWKRKGGDTKIKGKYDFHF